MNIMSLSPYVRPVSAWSFSSTQADGILPDFRDGVHLSISTAIRHRVVYRAAVWCSRREEVVVSFCNSFVAQKIKNVTRSISAPPQLISDEIDTRPIRIARPY